MDRKNEKPLPEQGKTRNRKTEKIPDYDDVFNEDGENKEKNKSFLKKILKRNRGNFIYYCFVYIIKALPIWIIPLVTGDVIDLIAERPEGYVTRIIIDAIILIFSIIQNIPTHVWNAHIVDGMTRRTIAGVKGSVIRKLQRLSITYHHEMESGKIQSKFLRDIDCVENYYRHFLLILVPNVIGVIVAVGISLFKNPIVTLFFAAFVPINTLLVLFFRKKMKNSNREFRAVNENLSARLTTMLQMITLTKAHGLVKEEISSIDNSINTVTRAGLKVDKVNAYFGSFSWVMSQLLGAICLLFCVFLAIKGVISAGEVVLFQSLFASINNAVTTLINIMPVMTVGKEAVSSLSEIMRAEDVEHDSNKRIVPEIEGEIVFSNVSYRYPNGDKDVVKNFTLDVKKGERIAVVGSSGSGKSTLMNLIIGLLSPTEGRIFVDGKPLDELPMQAYRHYISVVPQNSILFSGSIRENITYGMSYYSEEQFSKAIEDANILEFLPSLDKGIDTIVGEHGDKLSGGQKQRVCIARALIRNPRILILDEATSALDNVSEFHVQKAVDALVKDRTTFIVAHRLSTIRNADRIVVMENGQITEVGPYDFLMKKKGRFYQLEQLSRLSKEEQEG